MEAWDPESLVDLIVASGARYVVFVTKHHDGFVLWPTATPNPRKPGWNLRRDPRATSRGRFARAGCASASTTRAGSTGRSTPSRS